MIIFPVCKLRTFRQQWPSIHICNLKGFTTLFCCILYRQDVDGSLYPPAVCFIVTLFPRADTHLVIFELIVMNFDESDY